MRGRVAAALLLGVTALGGDGGAQAPAPATAAVQVRQAAYLKASNPEASDYFGCGGVLQGHTGRGVALSGDGSTLAVGAPHEAAGSKGVNGNQRDNSVFDAGAVYVYTRTGGGWSQQAYIKASNPQMSAGFGHFVALSDDGHTLAVSAFWESSNAKGINGNQQDESIPQAGAVYVFTRQGTAWTQQAYIKASNTGEAGTADAFGEGDQFGFSLALSGDGNTLAAGALTEDGGVAGINGNQADNSAASAGQCTSSRAPAARGRSRPTSSPRTSMPATCSVRSGAQPRWKRAGGGRLRRGRLHPPGERAARQSRQRQRRRLRVHSGRHHLVTAGLH